MGNPNTKEFWDEAWSKKRKFGKYIHNLVYSLIPEGAHVLEIGSGNGNFLRRLKTKGCKVFGIDISPLAVDKAAKNGVPGIAMSAENLDNLPGGYDFVFASHTLEHISNDTGFARNCGRLAKTAIVVVPQGDINLEEHVHIYDKTKLVDLFSPYFKENKEYSFGRNLFVVFSND